MKVLRLRELSHQGLTAMRSCHCHPSFCRELFKFSSYPNAYGNFGRPQGARPTVDGRRDYINRYNIFRVEKDFVNLYNLAHKSILM